MTQNTRMSLVAIQTTIVILTLLVFAAGLFGIRAVGKIEERQKKPSEMRFDEKMRPSIGKPYTEEMHYKILELMRISDGINVSANQSLTCASELMRDLGGLIALGSLTGIFLLLKKPSSSKQAKQGNLPSTATT